MKRISQLLALGCTGIGLITFVTASVYADTVFVSNRGDDTIASFDANGTGSIFATAADGLAKPLGLAFDGASNLYVVNAASGNSSIETFDLSGHGTIFSTQGLAQPDGIAINERNEAYVANFGSSGSAGTITRYGTNAIESVFATSASGFSLPVTVAFDGAGNLFVVSAETSTILKFDTSGVVSVFVSGGLNVPEGIAFDGAGNLYVANFGNNTIERFDTNGVGSVFATTGLDKPGGIAFDSAGNLYAVNFGNATIEKFDVNGNGVLFADTDLNIPTFIAILVPEPASETLVIAGFLVLLSACRLSRSRKRAHFCSAFPPNE